MNVIDGILATLKDQGKRIARLEVQEKPIFVPFYDYTASSTVTGWSAFTTEFIGISRIANMVWVRFYIAGTSNSTSTSFTVPWAQAEGATSHFVFRAQDNGGAIVAATGLISSAASLMQFTKDMTGNVWTASGTKLIAGQMFYWCA